MPVSGDSVTPSATPTDEPSDQPSGDKTEAGGPVQDNGSSSSDGGTPVGLIAGLGGGGVLLALLGAWAILRLRNKLTMATAHPASYPQAGPYPPQQQPGWQQHANQPNHPNQGPPQNPHQGPAPR